MRKIPQGEDEELAVALIAVYLQMIVLLESMQWIAKSSPGIEENLMKVHKEGMVKHPKHSNS